MKNLEVVNSGMVNIYYYQDQNERIVNARELHEFLEVGKRFTTWMKERANRYSFEEGMIKDVSSKE